MNKKNISIKILCMLLTFALLPCYITANEQPGTYNAATGADAVESISQTAVIKGVIVDSKEEPVIGATVLVKGTTTGTITDIDGKFTLNASPKDYLQISFIGYMPQEVAVGNHTTLKIVMREDNQLLDEVVVVGYGVVKKSDLTGAISSVNTETIVRGGAANAIGAIQGSVPGVQILRSNNKPGGGYDVKIRGINTMSGSSSPLVVIDGVPGANLDNINPDDIEKIDILKDASSTAIYGSRATNGVLMVTTKKGVVGSPRISYSGYAGFRNYTNLPDMMSGEEFVELAREASREMTPTGKNGKMMELEDIFKDNSELKAIQDGNYYKWIDAISSPAFMTNHTVSAVGGTDIAQYTISGGYYYEDGMLNPQEFSRYNLRAALDLQINKHVKFGGSLYFTHSVRDIGNTDLLRDAFRMRPTQHPNNLVTGKEEWKYASNGLFNPFITNKNEFNKTKKYNILSNVYVKITPMEGLDITSTFSADMTNDQIGRYQGVWTKALQGTAKGALSRLEKNNFTDWVWDNIINYKLLKGTHKIDLTGVFSMQQDQTEKMFGSTKDLSFNSLWYNLEGGTITELRSDYIQTNLMSYLGRVNYSLADKYLLTASLRYDGSSRLAKGHKWSLFPSVAVAWRITEESFMSNPGWLSNLKLRLSYGQTGNDNVEAYSTNEKIANSQYYSFGSNNVIGTFPDNLRNDKLGWERTSEYNIGLDFGFIDNRISGSVEYYNRLTDDVILKKSVPRHLGYQSVMDNVGSIRNQGFELLINTENVRAGNFSWQTAFTLAYNKNEIVDLAFTEDLGVYSDQLKGMKGDYGNKWFIGQPVDINWTFNTVGVWQTDEAAEATRYNQLPGQFKVKDFDNNGSIHGDKDRFIYGKKTPDWTGGITNTFRYQDFDLAFHMYFQAGARLTNQFFISYALENNNSIFNNLRKNYWTPSNPSNAMAQPSNFGPYRSSSSHVIHKTDLLKCAYITLGYTFRKNLLDRIRLSNLRLYATVQNPFIITSFSGPDPEQPSAHINDTDAMTRNVIFGLNVSF